MTVFEIQDAGTRMHLEFYDRTDFAQDDTTQEELTELINHGHTERQIILVIDDTVHTVRASAIPQHIRAALG